MSRCNILVHSGTGSFHNRWIDYLKRYGADFAKLDLRNRRTWGRIKQFDGVMWHLPMKPSFLQSTESILSPIEFVLKMNVFPNYFTRWHYEDKIAQKYLFDALSVPTPNTYVFWEKETAISWVLNEAKFPLVQKAARGAGSSHVRLVNNHKEAIRIINGIFSSRGTWNHKGYYNTTNRNGIRLILTHFANIGINCLDAVILMSTGKRQHLPNVYWMPEKDVVLFQEFYFGNQFDTRITVIGDRAFGFRRWNRPRDFRASGGGSIDYDQKLIDREMLSLAFRVSREGNFQSMAYDFLKDENGDPKICEMSFSFQNDAVYQCPGHWDSFLNYHNGHMWPEEAHVKDFLNCCLDKSLDSNQFCSRP